MVNVTRGFHGFDPQQPLRHTTSQHPRLQGAAGRTQQESQTGKLGLPLSLRNPYVCIYGYIDIIHACVCMYIHIYIYYIYMQIQFKNGVVYLYISIFHVYNCIYNITNYKHVYDDIYISMLMFQEVHIHVNVFTDVFVPTPTGMAIDW